jgi:hypothetical protein
MVSDFSLHYGIHFLEGSLLGESGRGVKTVTRCCLMTSSRMRWVVPLLPIHLRGMMLRVRNNSLGVGQVEVGNDPADDHTLCYGCGKVHHRVGSEMSFYTHYTFFSINRRNCVGIYQHMICSHSASVPQFVKYGLHYLNRIPSFFPWILSCFLVVDLYSGRNKPIWNSSRKHHDIREIILINH